MCLFRRRGIRDFDPKTRRIWAGGTLSLCVAILMTQFAEGWRTLHPALFDGLLVFFLGMALTFLIRSGRRMRRFDSYA